MFLLLFFLFLFLIVYLKVTDSSFNLFFWSHTNLRSEDIHYRGNIVWLVGGSSGIGESLALRISQFSPLLILSARRTELLEEVAQKCRKVNPNVKVKILVMDILDMDSHPRMCAEANEMFGRQVDIVILNTGRSQRAEWTDINPKVDEECFKINTLGPVQLTRCLLKHLGLHPTGEKTTNLQLIVVSSVAGYLSALLSPSYGASKAALNSYFRLLSLEMGEKGVKVSIVAPSLVFAPNNPLTAFTEESHNEVIDIPSSRHMNPDRAAQLISLAAVYELHECAISSSPIIFIFLSMSSLFPGLTIKTVNAIGAVKLRKLRTGKE